MDENNQTTQPTTPVQPEPAATPQSQATPQPVVMASTKKNKTPLMVGIIVAALLVVGGIAYGVYAYVTNTPDYLLQKGIEQISKETAFAAKFKITSGTEGTGMSFSGDIAARSDQGGKNGEAVIGFGAGDSRVTVTARVIDEVSYLRFGSLKNVGNLVKSFSPGMGAAYDTPDFKAALQRVDNQWFSVTKEEAASLAQGASPGSALSGFKQDDMKKLLEIYGKHQFFKADKSFADETIDGVQTAHFNIKMDKAAYKAFLTELKAANLESFKVTDSDLSSADKEADDFSKKTAIDFWITRDTKKIKQVKFAGIEKGSEGSLTLTLMTDLPKFDKLEKPTNAKPFSEFTTLLLGPSLYGPELYDSTYTY